VAKGSSRAESRRAGQGVNRCLALSPDFAVEAESACWRSPLRGAEASTAEFRLSGCLRTHVRSTGFGGFPE
jgi:hypothetical protein